jgi:hypothetical protein
VATLVAAFANEVGVSFQAMHG